MKEQQLPLQPNFIDSRKQKRQTLSYFSFRRGLVYQSKEKVNERGGAGVWIAVVVSLFHDS